MTDFTTHVLAEARVLLDRPPHCFRHADLASRLGPEFVAGGAQYDRLRSTLKRLRAARVFAAGGRGVFQAGAQIDNGAALSVRQRIVEGVEHFLAENGGIGRVKEMRRALALDDGQAWTLFRVLEEGRYWQLPKLQDERRWWALPEAELARTPLPGWRLDQDVSVSRYLGGAFAWRGGGWVEVDQRRREIGEGVRRARLRANLSVTDLLDDSTVGTEFRRCLEAGRSVFPDADGFTTYSEWWQERVGEIGPDDAALYAWGDFECGQRQGEPCACDNLDARFWRVLAARLGVDAADLSRGR